MSVTINISSAVVTTEDNPGRHDLVALTAVLPPAFPDGKRRHLTLSFSTDDGEGQKYVDAYFADSKTGQPQRVVVKNVYVQEKDRPIAHDEVMLIVGMPAPVKKDRQKEMENTSRLTLFF